MSFKLVRCADIIDVRDGTHDSPKYQNQGYPLITSKNINNNKIDFSTVNFISEEDYNKINSRSQVDNGDILMPMIGTVGNPVLVDTKQKFAIKNVALFKLSNNEVVMGKYFYYLLCSDIVKKQLEKSKRGGTQNFVSLKNLRDLRIPIVELNKQEKIVTILDKSYELIKIRKKQLELLNELVKSRFVEMFGDPIKNSKGWKCPKIEDVVANEKNAIKAGPFGSALKKEYYVDSGYKIYGQEQVIREDVDFGDYYITQEKYKELENCAIKSNDVLISLVGTYGKLLIIPEEFKAGIINPRLMKITFDKSKINTIYFKYFFQSESLKNKLSNNTHGGTMPILNVGIVRNIYIPLPPIELQTQFADFITQVDKLKFEMEKSLKELEDNFNSLMQKAFKGELF